MRPLKSRHRAVEDWLRKLVQTEDRRTLAALRRGLMDEEATLFALYGHVPSYLLRGLTGQRQRVLLKTISLAGFHPVLFDELELAERRRNLGDSLRLLAMVERSEGTDGGGAEEIEDELPDALRRRVAALLAAPVDQVFGYLQQIIGLLKSEEIPVDWAQLLADVEAWEWQGNPTQWDWSRSFYVGGEDKKGEGVDVP